MHSPITGALATPFPIPRKRKTTLLQGSDNKMISKMSFPGRTLVTFAAFLAPTYAWAAAVDTLPEPAAAVSRAAPLIAMAPAPSSLAGSTALPPPNCRLLPDTHAAECTMPDATATPVNWNLASLPSALPNGLAPAGEAGAPQVLGAGYQQQAEDTAPNAETGTVAALGPQDTQGARWTDHVPSAYSTHRGFWKQAGTVTTETLALFGYFSLMSGNKLFKETVPFHFKDEGWFGKNTQTVGIDKLTHAFNTYLVAEFLHARIHEETNGSQGDAITAAVIASGLMAFNEISDGIEPDSGYSMEDIVMNLAGAGFSVLRNTVPGLKEKVAFKLEIVPNDQIYSRTGKPHYEQMRYMFSIKGAGFTELEKTPLRYLDLQVGYYASDFLNEDRAAGIVPKRHLFLGVGLNVGELLFGRSKSGVGRAANTVLDYLQLPYTSLRYDTTGRLGS